MSTPFDRAVQDIGKYYGVPDANSKEGFVQALQNIAGADPADGVWKAYEPGNPINKVISMLQDTSQKGPGVALLAKKIKDSVAGSDNVTTGLMWDEQICIFNGKVEGEWGIYKGQETRGNDQGTKEFKKGTKNVGVLDIVEGLTKTGESAIINVNSTITAPNKSSTPNLSLIQVLSCLNTPASSGTGAAAVFMNAIPTLELSRCAAKLDITVVDDNAPVNNDNQLVAMGITQDLMGSVKFSDKTSPAWMMSTAADVAVLDSVRVSQKALEKGYVQETGTPSPYDVATLSTAGMEMFLSPQTMTSNQPYVDYGATTTIHSSTKSPDLKESDDAESSTPYGGARPTGVIDRFRPLAGIMSFRVAVQNGPGFMSWKTAEMELICYDRSRLYILAPLVKPDRYGKTRVIAAYGWSHPGGISSDPHTALSSGLTSHSGLRNSYATFLNGLQSREEYIVTNCSYNFGDDGTVKINITLSTNGGDRLNSVTIAQSHNSAKMKEGLEKLTKSVNIMRQKIMGSKSEGAKQLMQKSFMNSTATADAALSMPSEAEKALGKFLKGSAQGNADIDEIKTAIDKLLNEKVKYNRTVDAVISEKKKALTSTGDPFLRKLENAKKFVAGVKSEGPEPSYRASSRKYVSFGKILLTYVGMPLAASGNFDEVQIITYSMNAKASFVRSFNLGQYPINIARFTTQFEKIAKLGVDMPLSKFMRFMRKYFISAQGDYPYGFNQNWTLKDDGYQINKKKEKLLLDNNIKQALEAAYGPGEVKEELTFQLPSLSYYIEAVPLDLGNPEDGADPKDNRGKTLLRMHVYDSQCTGHVAEREILRASLNDAFGIFMTLSSNAGADKEGNKADHQKAFAESLKAAMTAGIVEPIDPKVSGKTEDIGKILNTPYTVKGGFAGVKRLVSYNMPTITYGSNATAIISANMSSQQNDLIATLSMNKAQGNDPTAPQGSAGGGPPMQLMPTKLSLTTFGCPFIKMGQEFFVDFGTGTSIDNIYVVISSSHELAAGEYKTSIELINREAFPSYSTSISTVNKARIAIEKLEKG